MMNTNNYSFNSPDSNSATTVEEGFQNVAPVLVSLSPDFQTHNIKHRPMMAVKTVFDKVVSFSGLLILSPLLLVIWIAVRRDSPGSALFKSKRVGKDGREFTMYKFRTMCVDAEARLAQLAHLNKGGPYMIKIDNDPRVTRLGRFLRKTSLDELPQLWNVLKGDMSLVGPRPQAPNEVALYTPYQRQRLVIRPGITGLWQVTSRHSPSFDEWVGLDLKYIATWSLGQDFKILYRTIGEVTGKKSPK